MSIHFTKPSILSELFKQNNFLDKSRGLLRHKHRNSVIVDVTILPLKSFDNKILH